MVREKIRKPEYEMSVALGDRYDGEPCLLDRMEMDKRNWLLGMKRLARKGYTVLQLQAILAECYETSTLIAASLAWASLRGNESLFEQAADLAGACTLDDLWDAYNTIKERDEFVAVVLAIIHYELLSTLKVGEYFPMIEIVEQGGEFFRKHGGRRKRSRVIGGRVV